MSIRTGNNVAIDPFVDSLVVGGEGVPKIVRERGEFFHFFATTVYSKLEERLPELEKLYCPDNGRPAEDPVRMLAVVLLQYVERLPDRQAAVACQYDLRWKLALRMRIDEPSFHPSSLTVFRERLLEGGLERAAFESCLDILIDGGYVRRRSKQRLDSTHIHGVLSLMSRLECERETIRVALLEIENLGLMPDGWSGLWSEYVEGKLDFRAGKEALQAKTAKAGGDMRVILDWVDAQPEWVRRNGKLALLRKVFDQNFEVGADGAPRQTRAQPSGSVQNPHEPEAQWCTKSTMKGKDWTGYKAQAVETVQDEPRPKGEPTANFITGMVTQPATEHDLVGMDKALEQQKSMGMERPESMYVDGAYVSGQSLHDAEREGWELHGPAHASPDRGKVFPSEKFDVRVEDRTAICPAGQDSTNCSRLTEAKTGKVSYRFEWNAVTCGACHMRADCVSEGQAHRTLVVGEFHSLLQARRNEMKTSEFKMEQRRRNGIEATHSELTRGYGLRKARYRGVRKVELQNFFIGAACNMRRLHRRQVWERRRQSC